MCEAQPINTGAILAIHALLSGVLDGKIRELRHLNIPVIDYGLIQGTVRGVERLVLVMSGDEMRTSRKSGEPTNKIRTFMNGSISS